MTIYSESDIRAGIEGLLDGHGLTWEQFIALGQSDELAYIDPDLDFAYRNLVPHLKDGSVPA
jgi:hypothetical protein